MPEALFEEENNEIKECAVCETSKFFIKSLFESRRGRCSKSGVLCHVTPANVTTYVMT